METFTVEEVRDRLKKLVNSASLDQKHFRIIADEGSVVMLSEETYDNLLITLELLSTPGLIDGLKKLQHGENDYDEVSPFSRN